MKKKNIMQISILPVVVMLGIFSLTMQPGQKGNGKPDKNNRQDKPGKSIQQESRGNGRSDKDFRDRGQGQGKPDKHNYKHYKENKDRAFKPVKYKGKSIAAFRTEKPGKNNRPSKDVIRGWNWNDGVLVWGLDDYANRKRPKDFKKITVCHQTGDGYPVTINISENALQAHLNHGDEVGDCNIDYSSWWSPRYVRSRENVYNVYEQSWENMSYSESLLQYALSRLLGVREDLDRNRAYYTPAQIERRQLLIRDLETNTGLLETRIGSTRQNLNGLNLIVQL